MLHGYNSVITAEGDCALRKHVHERGIVRAVPACGSPSAGWPGGLLHMVDADWRSASRRPHPPDISDVANIVSATGRAKPWPPSQAAALSAVGDRSAASA